MGQLPPQILITPKNDYKHAELKVEIVKVTFDGPQVHF